MLCNVRHCNTAIGRSKSRCVATTGSAKTRCGSRRSAALKRRGRCLPAGPSVCGDDRVVVDIDDHLIIDSQPLGRPARGQCLCCSLSLPLCRSLRSRMCARSLLFVSSTLAAVLLSSPVKAASFWLISSCRAVAVRSSRTTSPVARRWLALVPHGLLLPRDSLPSVPTAPRMWAGSVMSSLV